MKPTSATILEVRSSRHEAGGDQARQVRAKMIGRGHFHIETGELGAAGDFAAVRAGVEEEGGLLPEPEKVGGREALEASLVA